MWDFLSYAAWGISGLLLAWIVLDALKVSQHYDEELLMSSREGVDELDPEHVKEH
jgi:hypothetical protein